MAAIGGQALFNVRTGLVFAMVEECVPENPKPLNPNYLKTQKLLPFKLLHYLSEQHC